MWRGENFWSAGVKKNYTLPSVCFWHSAKSLFAECCICTLGKELTRQAGLTAGQNLPSVRRWHSVCLSTRQRGRLCRVLTLSIRQRPALPRVVSLSSVRVWALGKDSLCRVPEINKTQQSSWHSAELAIPVVIGPWYTTKLQIYRLSLLLNCYMSDVGLFSSLHIPHICC